MTITSPYENTPEKHRFIRVCSMLRKAVIDFPLNGNSEFKVEDEWDERWEKDVDNWDEANAVSSAYRSDTNLKGKHALLLDLDVEHVYVPSSTPYHGHLIINADLSKEDMLEVLHVLQKHNILQPGYVSAAHARGAAWLRTPWSRKP